MINILDCICSKWAILLKKVTNWGIGSTHKQGKKVLLCISRKQRVLLREKILRSGFYYFFLVWRQKGLFLAHCYQSSILESNNDYETNGCLPQCVQKYRNLPEWKAQKMDSDISTVGNELEIAEARLARRRRRLGRSRSLLLLHVPHAFSPSSRLSCCFSADELCSIFSISF